MSTKQSLFYLNENNLMIHIYREMKTSTYWLDIHGKTEGCSSLYKNDMNLPEDIAKKLVEMLGSPNNGICEQADTTKEWIEKYGHKGIDLCEAVDIVKGWIRKNVGNHLFAMQFMIERVRLDQWDNYECIVSLISDIGEERDYYIIHVNTKTEKIVAPLGKGRYDGKTINFKKINWETMVI